MKLLRIIVGIAIIVCMGSAPLVVGAAPTPVPELLIREIKITGDEMIVLQATANITDLSEYWVGYISNDAISPGSIVPTQQLPARSLLAGQAILLTSDGGFTCDAVYTTKLSMTLADTKGTFAIRHWQNSGQTSTVTTVDSVNWAKPSASGATTALIDLRKETTGLTTPVWYHDPSFVKPWRVGSLAACTLNLVSSAPGDQAENIEWVRLAVEPPAIIETVNEGPSTVDNGGSSSSNAGLAPPLVTELVPNPSGTGTDATDEFIELYNSNETAFDLSGFTLQTGLVTKHSYVFPSGVVIDAKSLRAFYSRQTGLSMSNTSGQAALLDRNGAVIAQSDPYDSAPDGQAWALASGNWYWTTKPTPGTTNIIAQPIALSAAALKKLTKASSSSTLSSGSGKVKAASNKQTSDKKKAVSTKQMKSSNEPTPTSQTTKIHPTILAAVAVAAVGYGAYVYRKDLANAVHKLRRH